MDIQYSAPDIDALDPRSSVIEKRGYTITFTLTELEANDRQMEKQAKELEAKRDYEAAKMTNIETNHPFVLDMSEQDLFTAHMYMEAKATRRVCDLKATEIRTQLAEDAAEIAEILKQVPALASVPSPAEFVPPAPEQEAGPEETDAEKAMKQQPSEKVEDKPEEEATQ